MFPRGWGFWEIDHGEDPRRIAICESQGPITFDVAAALLSAATLFRHTKSRGKWGCRSVGLRPMNDTITRSSCFRSAILAWRIRSSLAVVGLFWISNHHLPRSAQDRHCYLKIPLWERDLSQENENKWRLMGMVKEVFPAICDETMSSTDKPFRLYW
jgi:hypothetical protein